MPSVVFLYMQSYINGLFLPVLDVVTIEDRWKAYRNLVRGGFFFNDSLIVLADYSGDEKDIEEHVITNNDNEDSQTTENNETETEALSDFLNDGKYTRDNVKVRNYLFTFLLTCQPSK